MYPCDSLISSIIMQSVLALTLAMCVRFTNEGICASNLLHITENDYYSAYVAILLCTACRS